MRAQYQVMIMWDSRAQYEFYVRSGFEFQRGTRRPEGHHLTLLHLVWNENRALADSGPTSLSELAATLAREAAPTRQPEYSNVEA